MLPDSYSRGAENAAQTIFRTVKPIWAIVRHTRWRNDFLGCLYRWGSLCGDVPVAVVQTETPVEDVLASIKRITLQTRQRFPVPSKMLHRRMPKGLTGFQMGWATLKAISMLLGDVGVVVFSDQARQYPQYANDYEEMLLKHWNLFTISGEALRTSLMLMCGTVGAACSSYKPPAHRLRSTRAQRRLNSAYDYEELEAAPIRKWLRQRYPEVEWSDWRQGKLCGWIGDPVYETLLKVNAYCERKPSHIGTLTAWAYQTQVNEERLGLWRAWWQTNVVVPLKLKA